MAAFNVLRVVFATAVVCAVYLRSCQAAMPSFPLNNTAVKGLHIPALGVGTG